MANHDRLLPYVVVRVAPIDKVLRSLPDALRRLLVARPRLVFGESRAMTLSDQDREEDPAITKSDRELAAWLGEVNGQLQVLS